MSVSVFNRVWSKVLLETLVRQGVQHFCIAPGSRSTPLTLEAVALQNASKARCYAHFDERGLGFFALGIAKSVQQPVAVIVTSGTATAELYPAIIEARQSGVNLIVLTADRPPELWECGANQAILQQNMFADYPVAAINLPKPATDYAAQWLIATVEQACFKQRQCPGVVHINVPFAEPLYDANPAQIDNHPWLAPIQRWLSQNKPWQQHPEAQQEVLMHEHWDNWRTKRGVIVAGQLSPEQAMGINSWANTIVIQLGNRFISKRINQFLNEFNGEFWVVEAGQNDVDPYHHNLTRFNAKAHHWLRAHPPLRQKPWLLEPLALSKFCAGFIEQQVGGNLNEASLAHHIERVLPYNGILFLGNSLFVRLVDALTKLPEGYPIYTNRGASGIDGLLATAAGIAVGRDQPLVAMIGDTSTLYDLNSFALFKNVNQPTIIFVINNNGGAIFDMLPVDEEVKEQFYRLPHNSDFSQVAAMFDLKYAHPYTWADLSSVLKQAYARRKTTLIEIKTNPSDGSATYKRLIEQISHAVIGE